MKLQQRKSNLWEEAADSQEQISSEMNGSNEEWIQIKYVHVDLFFCEITNDLNNNL